MNHEALREVWRKTRDSQAFAERAADVSPMYAIVFTLAEMRALNELLAEGLTEPDHHEGNYAANLARGHGCDFPPHAPK